MNDDWFDLLGELVDAEARCMVVGAHALAVHGFPRATQDIDIWIDLAPDNVQRVWRALEKFGAPVDALGIGVADLARPDMVIQFGLPPNRIDLLTGISGVPDFAAAWHDRLVQEVRGRSIPFIGRAALLENKLAAGRTKDLADAELLEG